MRQVEHFLDPYAGPIAIGGADHVIDVLILLVFAVALIGGRHWVREHACVVRCSVLIVSVVQQTVSYIGYAATSNFWADGLPLHISRVSAILCAVYLATGSRRVMDVLGYFSAWAWLSFLYPSGVQPLDNLFGWTFLINHVITLLIPALAWITSDWRPTRPAIWRAFAWMVVYSLLAVGSNALTGGNYFYQREMPVASFLGQPWYYLSSLALGLAFFWVTYGVSRLIPDDGPALSLQGAGLLRLRT